MGDEARTGRLRPGSRARRAERSVLRAWGSRCPPKRLKAGEPSWPIRPTHHRMDWAIRRCLPSGAPGRGRRGDREPGRESIAVATAPAVSSAWCTGRRPARAIGPARGGRIRRGRAATCTDPLPFAQPVARVMAQPVRLTPPVPYRGPGGSGVGVRRLKDARTAVFERWEREAAPPDRRWPQSPAACGVVCGAAPIAPGAALTAEILSAVHG